MVTSLKDVQFESAAPLPDGDMLVQGVRMVSGEVPAEVHGFALADVVVTDTTGKSYALYAFAIYSDILIAPNLNDFSAAAPYEEVVYTFVFAVPAAQINDPFTLAFDGVSLGEITVGQTGIVSSGGEVAPEATATAAPTAAVTATPSPSPTLPPLLMNIPTKSSYEIYTLPSTSSERLVAAAVGFSPYVVGVNADQSWVYIYFFTPEGMRDGWIRSSRMNLDEAALSSLPVIDPQNLPVLPLLEHDELAVPVHLRQAVIQATADASTVREIYVVAPVQWNKTEYECDSVDGSPIREGDIVYFSFTNFALTRQAADSVRWNVRVDGKLLEGMSYVVEENVEEKGGEWTPPGQPRQAHTS